MHINTDLIVKLLQLPRIGSKTAARLLQNTADGNIETEQDLTEAVKAATSKFRLPAYTPADFQNAFRKGEDILCKSEREGIRILSWYQRDYPPSLRLMSREQAPLLLNVKGNLDALHELTGIAVIGTRRPSEFGLETARKLGYLLGKAGFNVVSGLALGCDTAGHRGCLDAGGTTTAVLASGLDKVDPKVNQALAAEIIDKGGSLVSEYFIGEPALNGRFVERDRIQAGLSACVSVVETGLESGTMHTVEFALSFQRLLAVAVHPPDKRSDKSLGNQQLLAQGKALGLSSDADLSALIARLQELVIGAEPQKTAILSAEPQ
jgi:DNA processing protein